MRPKESDRLVLEQLRRSNRISIDELSARVYYSPRVVQQALKRLEVAGAIVRHSSRGRVPNLYEVL